MNFIYSYFTHMGTVKETNQDALLIEKGQIGETYFYMFVVCDGMGGLEKGEVASAEVIHACGEWFRHRLPDIWQNQPEESIPGAIEISLKQLLNQENRKIGDYGRCRGISLGTTISLILVVGDIYYLIHVGDTRIYEIGSGVKKLTTDQTLVEEEVEMGKLTVEEAEKDSRRNVLLQCIGASESIAPQFLTGRVSPDTVYMLCSDGFRHELTDQELLQYFSPSGLSREHLAKVCAGLVQTVMDRGEQDNITVLAALSYREER